MEDERFTSYPQMSMIGALGLRRTETVVYEQSSVQCWGKKLSGRPTGTVGTDPLPLSPGILQANCASCTPFVILQVCADEEDLPRFFKLFASQARGRERESEREVE